jgi:uncharacterized membrane protein
MTAEQEYYDKLNLKSTERLIEMAKREQIIQNNSEIRHNMIRNILINRGEDLEKTRVFFEYHRFYKPENKEGE